MNAHVRTLTCGTALLCLLVSLSAPATNLAELPLKASVLAKPNVVFGRDDSGSMDWEVLMSTDDGIAWWNGSNSAWDSAANKAVYTSATSGNRLTHLFPMGTATGGQIYAIGSDNGRVAPPIAQLGWLRSSAFNPLYYNTKTSYPAWSPAYVSAALRNYADAPTTAAPSHPGPLSPTPVTLNVGTQWSSTNTNFSNSDYQFSVMPGMVLPIGTKIKASSSSSGLCSGSTLQTLSASTVVGSGSRCQASLPYYPATFWQRTVCPAGDAGCTAAPDCVASNPATNPDADCVSAPDGLGKLRRYEIKSGISFPSGRSFAAELQNFANWFSYYRKRKLMLAGAMGRALEPLTGVRLGVVPFCDGSSSDACAVPTMFDADSSNNASNRRAAAGTFYLNALSSQGTPTHNTVKYIADQFNTNTNIVQYACQRNNLFVVTDGFSNTTAITPPSWDSGKSASTWGAGAPYQITANGSLADLGLRYYTNRLRASGANALSAGRLPSGDPTRRNPDLNTDLHITTYGITLGARGKLFPDVSNPFATDVFATPPTWPTPVADDPSMIDDLWHATVNGRGQMYLAGDVESLKAAIQSAFNDILNQEGSQASVAVSSVNLDRGDSQAYLGSYNPAGWSGDLSANPIDPSTAALSTIENWSAASLLSTRDWTARLVFSSGGSSGLDFNAANVGAAVNPDAASFTNQQVVDYLRGNRNGEGSMFRARTSLIGAVVNAEPVLAREERAVYLASGDGMLHALDTLSGKEEWAYAPPDTLANLGQSVQRGWVYQTLLDATPAYGRLSSGKKLLVGGLGAAGRSYYALDVSNPKNLNTAAAVAQFRWIFPASADAANRAKMGYTIGKPVITRTGDGDVVLLSSGVDNAQAVGDGKGRLWVINASTGAVIKTFKTAAGSTAAEAGLSHVSAFKETDGSVRYAFGGDLLGNVWRFDLEKTGVGELDADLVAVLLDASGNTQPVTSAPEMISLNGKRVILLGTGRLLDISDFGNSRTQSFYAIADGPTLNNARASLVRQVYSRGSNGAGTLTRNTVNWVSDRGWYLDLPAGEQANTDPIVTYGAVAFVSNINGATDCSQSSFLYLIDVGSGSLTSGETTASWLIAANASSSRVITLRVIDGKIVGVTHRSDNGVFQQRLPLGQTITPAKSAWREIRR